MKKIMIKTVVMAVMMFGMSMNANAQLSNILNKVASAAGQNSTLGNVVSSVIGVVNDKLVPTEDQVVGTWSYQSPAIVFNSKNALTNVGGAAASKTIETKLQTYLSKYGIKKGQMSITFNKDKTFSVNYKTKKITGTYVINGNSVVMTFKGRTQPCKLTPQLDNGQLCIVADATKLKNFVQGLGASATSAEIATIVSLLKQVDGMLLGIRLSK